MLVRIDMSLVKVALCVGFQTRSHFTTVFKRFVGEPPLAWRESRDTAKSAGAQRARARTHKSHRSTAARSRSAFLPRSRIVDVAEGPCFAEPERGSDMARARDDASPRQHGTAPCVSRPDGISQRRSRRELTSRGHILRRRGGGGGGGGGRTRCQIVPLSNWIVMPSGE
jgi:hypothetical protein